MPFASVALCFMSRSFPTKWNWQPFYFFPLRFFSFHFYLLWMHDGMLLKSLDFFMYNSYLDLNWNGHYSSISSLGSVVKSQHQFFSFVSARYLCLDCDTFFHNIFLTLFFRRLSSSSPLRKMTQVSVQLFYHRSITFG